ncbi:membrane bound O-acyl transferase family-domain-containing protein [Amylocystis lapponica]|nr:membrane bound O-acyl transferase family-domain-containing protein [Amylocystis lapponica]
MEPDFQAQSRTPLPFLTYWVLPNVAVSCVIALGLRQPFPVHLAVVAAVAYAAFRAVTLFTTGDAVQDYCVGGVFVSMLFNAVHMLLLSDPLKEFRHETDTVPPTDLPFLRRVYWALSVVNNARGVGWNYQVAHLPPPPTSTRRAFIIGRLYRIAIVYLAMDALQSFMLHVLNPMYLPEGGDALPMTAHGVVWLCINVVCRWPFAYYLILLQQWVLAVAHVALGLSEPRHWPDICGSWLDSYTVRRFWGRTWHQMLRRQLSAIGKWFCRVLGFRPGSWQSSYTQLYIAFTLSGLLHMGGDVMLGKGTFGESFWFFFVQALAITFEDAVIGAAKKAGIRFSMPVERALGYAWTFAWGCYSLNVHLSYMLRIRLGEASVLPFSPVMKVLGHPKVQAFLVDSLAWHS